MGHIHALGRLSLDSESQLSVPLYFSSNLSRPVKSLPVKSLHPAKLSIAARRLGLCLPNSRASDQPHHGPIFAPIAFTVPSPRHHHVEQRPNRPARSARRERASLECRGPAEPGDPMGGGMCRDAVEVVSGHGVWGADQAQGAVMVCDRCSWVCGALYRCCSWGV